MVLQASFPNFGDVLNFMTTRHTTHICTYARAIGLLGLVFFFGCFAGAPDRNQKDCTENCADGFSCVRGKCVQACNDDGDCSNTDTCLSGRCELYDAACGEGLAECAAGWFCGAEQKCQKIL